ncbi:MAG: hypothetical protein Q4A97_00460, partial [Comamonadaceae bacterium]|nr:hypothetical protein [Comamonadaceae bacterium]
MPQRLTHHHGNARIHGNIRPAAASPQSFFQGTSRLASSDALGVAPRIWRQAAFCAADASAGMQNACLTCPGTIAKGPGHDNSGQPAEKRAILPHSNPSPAPGAKAAPEDCGSSASGRRIARFLAIGARPCHCPITRTDAASPRACRMHSALRVSKCCIRPLSALPAMLSFQHIILKLQQYWADQGCALLQ